MNIDAYTLPLAHIHEFNRHKNTHTNTHTHTHKDTHTHMLANTQWVVIGG